MMMLGIMRGYHGIAVHTRSLALCNMKVIAMIYHDNEKFIEH